VNGGKLLNREERKKKALEGARGGEIGFGQEKSVFHGSSSSVSLSREAVFPPTFVVTKVSRSLSAFRSGN
jgi:pre-mRNA-processing factor 17